MDGQPTRARWHRLPAEWHAFGAFLRRPELPPRATLSLGATARALPSLFGLDMLLMGAVLGTISLAAALGMTMPDHLLTEMKVGPVLVVFIVIGAPIAEEALFRGWLSGRPGHVLATLALVAGFAVFALAAGPAAKVAGLVGGLLFAGLALYALRNRDAWTFFRRHFAWFFYASALLFAAVHLTNFAAGSARMLPLVLPQFVLALLLGYLRVNRGLMAGATLHMLHNAVFAAFIVIGSSAP